MNTFVTQLRWPASLREAVIAASVKSRRSMNAEILARLEASLTPEAETGERAA
jgi:hypothetical protein